MAYMANLKDKLIGVLGLGVSGLSCVCLLRKNNIKPFVMDADLESRGVQQVKTLFSDTEVYTLPKSVDNDDSPILDADILIVSPGIALATPIIQAAIAEGVEVIGDVELFARLNRKPVVAISGSNGKSTVTKLVTLMLKNAGYDAEPGGNIGVPVLELLDKKPFDIAVLELSSFQLETTTSLHAQAAVILNISEDHMDRYDSYDDYVKAKQRIYSHADIAVFNDSDSQTAPSLEHPSQLCFAYDLPENTEATMVGIYNDQFALIQGGEIQTICPLDSLKLMGRHNVLNALAAIALTLPFKLSNKVIEQSFKQFDGLPHRCELVDETAGVKWVNDSKATNVGATVAALNGIAPQVKGKLILLAGGLGKDADFAPLKSALEAHVDCLITFGRDGDQIAALMDSSWCVDSLEAAVVKAFALAREGDCVLLSPACASFDMFDSFEHRGKRFTTLVKEVNDGH